MSVVGLFDSHCHLDSTAFDPDRAAVLARAREVGVEALLVPGMDPLQWRGLRALAAAHEGVAVAVGLHPQRLGDLASRAIADGLTDLAAVARAVGAVAIGECGLDRSTAQRGLGYERQVEVLDAHVEVARALGLPLVLHVLGAQAQALACLERHGPLPAGGVLHSYSGPAQLVPRWAALGLRFSFAGGVTRRGARRTLEAARAVPDDLLLVETDAPDQPPHLAPAHRNEPAFLTRILDALAAARGQDAGALGAQTARNARALFGA